MYRVNSDELYFARVCSFLGCYILFITLLNVSFVCRSMDRFVFRVYFLDPWLTYFSVCNVCTLVYQCGYVWCGASCVYVSAWEHCIFSKRIFSVFQICVLFGLCMHPGVLVWLCVMWSVLCLWHFRLLLLTLDNPLPTILLATTTKKPFYSRSARASTSTSMSSTITTATPYLGQPSANPIAGNHNQETFLL